MSGFDDWAAAINALAPAPEPEPPTIDLPMAPPPTVEEIRGMPALVAPECDRCGRPLAAGEHRCYDCTTVLPALKAAYDEYTAEPAPAPLVSAPTVAATPEPFEQPAPAPIAPPPVAPVTGLSQTAVLVDFTRTGWTASVRDKTITDAVIASAGAKKTAGHFHKQLMPDGAPAVKAVRQAIQNAYEDYRARTAPWLDSGTRIMSTNGYQDFLAAQREHAGRIEAAKRVLRTKYNSEVDKQQATLGALFNRKDYPTADEVVSAFNAGFRVLPVPDSTSDFRMAVGEQEREMLRQAYDEYTAEMIRANKAETARRVDKEVRHLADRMKAYDGTQTGAFRNTIVDNVRRMAEMLDSINITGDPEVTALADRIKADLCQTDVDTLRKDPEQREDLAKKADAILADMSAFIA